MNYNKVEFKASYAKFNQIPKSEKLEFAFSGRSNVGKSSLINMLCQYDGLAKTSSKPGKTLLINHFKINDAWYLVDLPGYGYAQVSLQQREKLHKMITDYVEHREQLYCLFVLVDSRLKPQQIDLDFMDFLGEAGVPFAIVMTKTDKISQSELNKNLKVFKAKMLETWEELPEIFLTSSEKKRGRDAMLDYIEQVLQS